MTYTVGAAQSEQQLAQIPRGESPTALTAPTEGYFPQSAQLVQLEQDLESSAPTVHPLPYTPSKENS